MFEKLANFRLFQPWRRAPQAYQGVAANDNLAITLRSGRQRRIGPPELTCHWSLDEGGTRLTCRWQAGPLPQLTREACEEVQAGRAKHRAARKRSNRPIDPTRTQTVRT
jgi:hypothetical protein